jgi:hypothetical protein
LIVEEIADYDFLTGEGTELLFYQSWASLYDWFEGWGIPPDVELPWTDVRRSMIETGEARPTQRELLEWRDAVIGREHPRAPAASRSG